jgi:GAF domain-containing protein
MAPPLEGGASAQAPRPPLDRAACQRGRLCRLLRRLLAETTAACQAAEATLWTPSADRSALEGALNHGHTPAVLESVAVPVDDSVVGLVFRTGVAACIGPGDPHNPSVDERTGLPTLAMAAAPVRCGSEVAAVLSAINPARGSTFSRADLEALEWKAYLAGLVLEDARDEE